MPEARIWNNRRELLSELKNFSWRAAFSKLQSEIPNNWQAIIRLSVGPNTFRGLRGAPSEVFRPWAYQALVERGYFDLLLRVDSAQAYSDWHEELASDLDRQWKVDSKRGVVKELTNGSTL